MATALTRYEAARTALAEAQRIDEVKDIRDKMVALAAYARQAKDTELISYATEIRLRAERRLGQMLKEQKETVGLNQGTAGKGRPRIGGSREELPKDNRPTLASAGIDKKLSARAQKTAAIPEKAFEDRMLDLKAAVVSAAERTAEERQIEKQERRAEREAELGAVQRAMPEKRYGVIYADPPWRFEPYSRESGMDRAADNHYPTMTLDDIKALPVPAADDCALFLWATAPMLPQALEVMAAWGFTYKSHCVWVKDKPGTGYWFRNQHELLLVGTRGAIPAPASIGRPSSVFEADRGVHSAKPHEFRLMIAWAFPTLPKIELFARTNTPGWDTWGLEAPVDEEFDFEKEEPPL